VTSYSVTDGRVISHGVSPLRIEQVTGHSVPRLRIADLSGSGAGGKPGAFYRPPALAGSAGAVRGEFASTRLSRTAQPTQNQNSGLGVRAPRAAGSSGSDTHSPTRTPRPGADQQSNAARHQPAGSTRPVGTPSHAPRADRAPGADSGNSAAQPQTLRPTPPPPQRQPQQQPAPKTVPQAKKTPEPDKSRQPPP
jgi:hypothetical protein